MVGCLCQSFHFSYKDTGHIGLRARPSPIRLTGILIVSVRTLFSDKIVGSTSQDWNISFWGSTNPPIAARFSAWSVFSLRDSRRSHPLRPSAGLPVPGPPELRGTSLLWVRSPMYSLLLTGVNDDCLFVSVSVSRARRGHPRGRVPADAQPRGPVSSARHSWRLHDAAPNATALD